jgi:lipopolysaccharide/colanic/teichoic acid biosynthesis glycosyltransferase
MIKRIFDICVALLGLVMCLPVLALIALAVRLGSPGPVFFRQVRVGMGGRDFVLYKFRTMSVCEGSEGGSFEPGDGSRVTKLGRRLRATKLDELPQLWNVIKGTMSLVGPRPEVRRWVEIAPERWMIVHSIRPGITDPASILFRNEEQILAASIDPERLYRQEILPRKLDHYEAYARSRSFLGDLAILWKTALVIVT